MPNYKDPQLSQYTCTGNLGQDIEVKYLNNDNATPVVNGSVAVTRGFKDNKKTLWVNFSIFGKAAERMDGWTKGSRVMLGGDLEPDDYGDKQGFKCNARFCNETTWPEDQG